MFAKFLHQEVMGKKQTHIYSSIFEIDHALSACFSCLYIVFIVYLYEPGINVISPVLQMLKLRLERGK